MIIKDLKKVDWGKVKAVFTLVTYEGIEIKDFKIVTGQNGDFVSMPSRKGTDDNYYATVWFPKEKLPDLNQIAIAEFNKEEPVKQETSDEGPL